MISLEFRRDTRGNIVAQRREYHGIERPDYTTIERFTPIQLAKLIDYLQTEFAAEMRDALAAEKAERMRRDAEEADLCAGWGI